LFRQFNPCRGYVAERHGAPAVEKYVAGGGHAGDGAAEEAFTYRDPASGVLHVPVDGRELRGSAGRINSVHILIPRAVDEDVGIAAHAGHRRVGDGENRHSCDGGVERVASGEQDSFGGLSRLGLAGGDGILAAAHYGAGDIHDLNYNNLNYNLWRCTCLKNQTMKTAPTKTTQPFLTDVKELRKRARANIDKGAITPAYKGDVKQTVEILQSVLATEIVCVLRYTMNAITATGISSDSVKEEFEEHAREEQGHARQVAERINQLGGKPNFNPEGLASRSASQYVEGANLVEMIKENLIAERIACEHYRELIRYFGDNDSTTRVMMEGILTNEEEHANDMHDLLVAHEGRPMLATN
jgi:bacterioferritin